MSALGQKQTFATHPRMSALPPKAYISASQTNFSCVECNRRRRECRFGIVGHDFQWTVSISEAFQTIGMRSKKMFWPENRH